MLLRHSMSCAVRMVRLHDVLRPAVVNGVRGIQNSPVSGSSAREGNASN
jgi:hypothetical protein